MNQSTHPQGGDQLSRALRWGLLLLPLLIAAVAGWLRWPESQPDPVDVTSSGPLYATIGELAAASGLIVMGTVDTSGPGRTISDPTNPSAAITTTLYSITVEQTLQGTSAALVIVEHETALADGTPITINGVPAPSTGERTLLFLIEGTTEDFPHHAIINDQGRYLANGEQLTAIGQDALSQAIGQGTFTEIRVAIAVHD